MSHILPSVSKKTALLQAEASARVLGLANVLFCGSAVSFFFFSHCKITTVVSFLRLVGNGGGMRSWRSDESLSVRPKLRLGRDSTCRIRTNPAMPYTTCCTKPKGS